MRVILGVGLERVRFGMTREQVRAALGPPEEIAVHPVGDDSSEAWYYWAQGISTYFDSDVGWRLSTLEVSDAAAEIHGQRIIGATEAEVRRVLPGVPLDWDGDEFNPASVDAWSLNLWIEDGVVRHIQWGVPIGDDDEECWPEQSLPD